MASNYIGITFPFKQSDKGFLLDLTSTDNSAIKSDLMHLILTNKGERLYNPEFGTNLLKFIFQPNDELTLNGIRQEIKDTVTKYLPKLTIDDISVTTPPTNEYVAQVSIAFTVTDDVFTTNDVVIINI